MSRTAAAMAAHAGSFDMIPDVVSAHRDINAYLRLLKRDVRYRFVIDMATLES